MDEQLRKKRSEMRVSMYRAAAILAAFALTETYAIRLEALEAATGEDATVPTLT